MTNLLSKAWAEVVSPMFRRPCRVQVAALCWRQKAGEKQVLLITSRDTGRWILPKGWPIDGLNLPKAAKQEAWEEAGVRKGQLGGAPVGAFTYDKRHDGGFTMPCTAQVFPIEVTDLSKDFPEADERRRKWVSPAKAAEMVDEPELRDLLRTF